ncbi:MAG TPA: ABC transporter permease [Bryobacteraceae bacterium]|nr:ABC transporter permease [Bryobacteraceae bacterium]
MLWPAKIVRELAYAARTLRKSPSFTIPAILTLAIGIAANTAIFSIVKAVLLNSLPYADPARLVTIAITTPTQPDNALVDPVTAEDLRVRSDSLESVSLYGDAAPTFIQNGEGEIVRGLRISANFFETLGVKMQLGRAFLPEEDRPDRRFTAVILSHQFWMRHFGGDARAVGRVLDFNGFHYTITGILPASFAPLLHGTTELLPEIYMPAGIDYSSACRGCFGPRAIARLKPGITVESARAELNAVIRGIARDYPSSYHASTALSIMPVGDFLFGRVRLALWAVLGAVVFVFLIACANTANLLLARNASRSKETAVRAALGARRSDLMRESFLESLLLTAAGGMAGLFLAAALIPAFSSVLPRQVPRLGDIHLDGGVFWFSVAATFAAAILCGIGPASHATRLDLNATLKNGGTVPFGAQRAQLRRVLVIGEIALAFVLVAGALLLAKSFVRLLHVDPGYRPQNVLTLSSSVWGPRYDDEGAILRYYQEALQRVVRTPGVQAAAWTSMLPLDAADREPLRIEGGSTARESDAPLVETYSVSPDYFQVMGIPLKRGRAFTQADTFDSPRVALISESCARAHFPMQDPIGKRIRLGARDAGKSWATIVGIVGDIRQYGLERPSNGEAYVAQSQGVIIEYYRLVARTTVPPAGLEQRVREAVASVDRTQPVYHTKSLEDYLAGTLAPRTIAATLLGVFSALAFALGVVGVYGLISYNVRLRLREIAIRVSLGARRRSVVFMIARESLTLAAAGIAIGFAGSQVLHRFLKSLLFDVAPNDAASIAATIALLFLGALVASYLPAWRASRVDPAITLRSD